MTRARFRRRSLALGGAGLFALVLLGLTLGGGGDEDPAPPAVLNRIGDKNEDAAANAAARMKAESEAAAEAADARLARKEAAAEAAENLAGQR